MSVDSPATHTLPFPTARDPTKPLTAVRLVPNLRGARGPVGFCRTVKLVRKCLRDYSGTLTVTRLDSIDTCIFYRDGGSYRMP